MTDQNSLNQIMMQKRGGDSLQLTIFRDGRTQKVNVKLGSAPEALR